LSFRRLLTLKVIWPLRRDDIPPFKALFFCVMIGTPDWKLRGLSSPAADDDDDDDDGQPHHQRDAKSQQIVSETLRHGVDHARFVDVVKTKSTNMGNQSLT
jgi:hypothetical protein